MNHVLDTIVAHKQHELLAVRQDRRDFVAAMRRHGPGAVIAEYKRASPSAGTINTTLSIEEAAQQYQAGGAAAISILTDRHFFQGQLEYLRQARAVCTLPLLRKDFIIDPLQVYESKLAGADAILLIARILSEEQLVRLAATAHELGLQILVEIHERSEIQKALRCSPDMLGINSRNLQTMTTDLTVIEDVIAAVPTNVVVVAESGVTSAAEVRHLAQCGAQAVLVGTHLMTAHNQQAAVAALVQPAIKICGVTNEADAFMAAQAGAQYLGYIVYAPNRQRAIDLQTAATIVRHVRTVYPSVQHVGVFVDASPQYIQQAVRDLDLDVVQLHGHESVAYILALRKKLMRQPAHATQPLIWKSIIVQTAEDIIKIQHYEPHVDAIHLDAGRGSGHMMSEALLQSVQVMKPMVLAGGITPANVTQFLRYQPTVIDVSSGVEIVRGKKDVTLIKQLIHNCYAATV